MQVRVLGAHNLETTSAHHTCFLVGGVLAIDAGSIVSTPGRDEQLRLRHVLLTHLHFDHTRGIPTLGLQTLDDPYTVGVFSLGVTVTREYGELPPVEAHGSELNQVWTNIIDNAIDAIDGDGEIVLRARTEGDWVTVEIEDNGPGIPKEIQGRIFDAFFTTKPPGKGTGMGLDITYNNVAYKHHGDISVASEPEKTVFSIRLPVKG